MPPIMQQSDDYNPENEFRLLYRQFLANELSEAELNRFLEQLTLQEREEAMIALMSQTWQETQPVPMAPLYNTEWQLTGKARRWWPLAIAAVLAGLLATGLWLFTTTNKPSHQSSQISDQRSANQQINKALLVLADGRRIILDSMENGTVAQQGNMMIRKQANGVIAYELQPQQNDDAVGYNTLSTPKGGVFSISLPDGSRVWLNSVSSLTYPTSFKGTSREVTLKGEAYFEIAANAAQPFLVKNERMEVKVLGTAFNMMCYADEAIARTTLLNGSVLATHGGKTQVLHPGEQVASDGAGWKLVRNADLDEVLAWKNGLFQLNHADVATVLRQVARWYDVEVVYKSEVPQKKLVGYLGREEGLDKMVEVLKTNGIPCSIENKQLIIQ